MAQMTTHVSPVQHMGGAEAKRARTCVRTPCLDLRQLSVMRRAWLTNSAAKFSCLSRRNS